MAESCDSQTMDLQTRQLVQAMNNLNQKIDALRAARERLAQLLTGETNRRGDPVSAGEQLASAAWDMMRMDVQDSGVGYVFGRAEE